MSLIFEIRKAHLTVATVKAHRKTLLNTKKLSIFKTLSSAWKLTHSDKNVLWVNVACVLLISFALQFFIYSLFHVDPEDTPYAIKYIFSPIIFDFVTAPFYANAIMLGIDRYRGHPIDVAKGFRYFDRWFYLTALLIGIGFVCQLFIRVVELPRFEFDTSTYVVLHIIAGIWFMVWSGLLCLIIPIILDKNYTLWRAVRLSIKLTAPNLLAVILSFFIGWMLVFIPFLPFLWGVHIHHTGFMIAGLLLGTLGSIWTMPLLILIYGAVYSQLIDSNQHLR